MIREDFYKDVSGRMEKAVSAFENELGGFRTGRANPKLVEDIDVEVYGSRMKLKELATISVPEPRLIVIQPWDKSALTSIEKAIRISDLKVSPVSEGGVVRIPLPPLSDERRKEMAKVISKKAEEARVAVRNVRQESMNRMQELKKKGESTEDEEKRGRERVQKMTDSAIVKIDQAMTQKTEELQKI